MVDVPRWHIITLRLEFADWSLHGPPSFRGGGIQTMSSEAGCDRCRSEGAGAGRGHLGADMRW